MDSAVRQKVENIHFSCLLPRGRQPNPKYFKYFGFEHPPRGDHSNRDYLNNYGTGPETKVKLFRTLTERTKLHFQVYLWIRTIFLNFEELFARWQGPDKQHINYGNFEPCLLLRIPEYLTGNYSHTTGGPSDCGSSPRCSTRCRSQILVYSTFTVAIKYHNLILVSSFH